MNNFELREKLAFLVGVQDETKIVFEYAGQELVLDLETKAVLKDYEKDETYLSFKLVCR